MVRTLLGLLLILAIAGPAGGDDGSSEPAKVPLSTARANAKGNELAGEGKFGEAAEVYREEALIRPENGILQRNLAGALARSGSMEEGLAAYGQALRFAETPGQKAKALFDLGNALAMGGQAQQALETYASAMLLDPTDMDIKHNFEYLMKQSQQGDQKGNQQKEGDEKKDGEQEGENQEGEDQQDQKQEQNAEEQEGEQQQQPQPGDEDEQQPQPSQDAGETEEDQSMNPEDAKRLLDALLEEEKELQAERSRREQTQDHRVEKDW